MKSLYENDYLVEIGKLENKIDKLKVEIIKEHSDNIIKELGIESKDIFIPVYYYADEYPNDWQYTIVYVLNRALTKQIDAFCVFDRYGDRLSSEHKYCELLRNVETHQEDWIPDSVDEILEEK